MTIFENGKQRIQISLKKSYWKVESGKVDSWGHNLNIGIFDSTVIFQVFFKQHCKKFKYFKVYGHLQTAE